MEVIPIHYEVSKPVRKYFEIEDDAANMMRMLDNKAFKGYSSTGYALAHCQVTRRCRSFFVLDQSIVDKKLFEDRVIINPRIVRAKLHTDIISGERYGISLPNYRKHFEGCLSFPHRRGCSVYRFDRIKVVYYIKGGLFGLKKRKKWLTGLASQIFQHEYDHILGKNIFFQNHKNVAYTAGLPTE